MAEEAEAAALQLAEGQNEIVLDSLAAHINTCWTAAKNSRAPQTERFQNCLRRRNGEYDPAVQAEVDEIGGSDVFVMLTDEKCTAAASWLEDVLFPAGEKPWSVEPTPKPEVPGALKKLAMQQLAQEVKTVEAQGMLVPDAEIIKRGEKLREQVEKIALEMARSKAERAEVVIDDLYRQGGFYTALREILDDFVTYPVCYMRGPVIRRSKRLSWGGGTQGVVVTNDVAPEWERVSPFDIYPAPSATKIGEGYLIHINWLTDADLYDLIGVPGFNETEIRKILDGECGNVRDWLWAEEQTRQTLEDRQNEWMDPTGRIPAVQFWGPIPGKLLREWGLSEKECPDEQKPYDAEVWMVGPKVIKATLNPDKLGRIPYYKASYREKPGSWYGRAPAELMADCQDMCNASVRALANNLGLSSGPQVAVDVSTLPSGESVEGLRPWKIWQYNGLVLQSSSHKPIDFFQPSSNANELLAVYEKFSTIAENVTGIPKYTYGQGGGGGVLSTASGMAMMMNNAAKTLKKALSAFDHGIIEVACEQFYDWMLQFSNDESIKGDCRIVARGSSALIFREQQTLRRNEFLQTTANPVDLQIMGIEGRRELLRENAKALDLPTDKIIPELPPGAAPQGPGAPPPEAGAVEPNPDPMAIPGRPPVLTVEEGPGGGVVRDGGTGARIV